MDTKGTNQSKLSDHILSVVEKTSPAVAERWAKNKEDIMSAERLDKLMAETNSEALSTQLINCGVFLGLTSKTREEAGAVAEEVSEVLQGSRHLEPRDRQHHLGYALVDMYQRCEFAMPGAEDESFASMERHLGDMADTLAKVHASPSCGSGLKDKIEILRERERGSKNRTDGRLHRAMAEEREKLNAFSSQIKSDGLHATIANLKKGEQLEENPEVSWAGQVRFREREVTARGLARVEPVRLDGNLRAPVKLRKGTVAQTAMDGRVGRSPHEK